SSILFSIRLHPHPTLFPYTTLFRSGLPLGISPYIFYYNKEIFEKYGLEIPETYDDLLEIVDVLKEHDVYPIALANQPKWPGAFLDRKSTRLNSSHVKISYAVFCLKK